MAKYATDYVPACLRHIGESTSAQDQRQRAALSVENAPTGWSVELRGGGRTVGAAYVDYNGKTSLELKIKLPPDARPGQQSLVVKAQTADGA